MRLATFVHISDLHLGPKQPNALLKPISKLVPRFNGLLGHHFKALRQLEIFLHDLRERERARIIVTGDLTQFGHPDHFDFVSEFLGAQATLPDGRSIGLSEPDWRERGIPGNHDQWAGRPYPIGPATPKLTAVFPNLPFVSPLRPISPDVHIRFLGIDSDADVGPNSRMLARGDCETQLTTLAAKLHSLPREPSEIRVLLIHHSRSHRGTAFGAEKLSSRSRQTLDAFLVQCQVPIVLSGHTHVPYVRPFLATSAAALQGSEGLCALEARSGTTTQRDTLNDDDAADNLPLAQALKRNSLLVHRILEVDGQVFWYSETYRRARSGFALASALPHAGIRVLPL